MCPEKEKKPSKTTVTKLAYAIGLFVAVIGVIFIITNLIGFTDMDWHRVILIFVFPCAIFIFDTHEKRK